MKKPALNINPTRAILPHPLIEAWAKRHGRTLVGPFPTSTPPKRRGVYLVALTDGTQSMRDYEPRPPDNGSWFYGITAPTYADASKCVAVGHTYTAIPETQMRNVYWWGLSASGAPITVVNVLA